MTLDQSSLVVAGRRQIQLTVALAVAAVAFVLAVAAVVGGMFIAVAVVIGTILTGAVLVTSLRSWRGAAEVWSGNSDPARLRGLVRRSLLPSAPALIVSFAVALGVAIPPLSRVFSDSATSGNATWTDAVLLLAVVLYVSSSVGACLYPLSVRR